MSGTHKLLPWVCAGATASAISRPFVVGIEPFWRGLSAVTSTGGTSNAESRWLYVLERGQTLREVTFLSHPGRCQLAGRKTRAYRGKESLWHFHMQNEAVTLTTGSE